MTAHRLDISGWKRREHFELYHGFANPFFSLCADIDTTRVWERSRESGGPPFFLAAVYAALRAVNDTEAFRLRIRGDEVWRHDRVAMSSTIMRPDDTFGFARFELEGDFMAFRARGEAAIEQARTSPALDVQGGEDLVYHSTIPWIRLTAFSNPIGRSGDCIPRLVFGKVSREENSWRMPVAVEVHHGLVDGLDVARFLERLQSALADW